MRLLQRGLGGVGDVGAAFLEINGGEVGTIPGEGEDPGVADFEAGTEAHNAEVGAAIGESFDGRACDVAAVLEAEDGEVAAAGRKRDHSWSQGLGEGKGAWSRRAILSSPTRRPHLHLYHRC